MRRLRAIRFPLHPFRGIQGARGFGDVGKSSSVDEEEVRKFGQLAEKWWDPNGPQAMLHLMNPARIGYIRHRMATQYGIVAEPDDPSRPFAGFSFLDIGCGGGFAAESLSRLGGDVLGVDAAHESISVATRHAEETGLIGESSSYKLRYECSTAEILCEQKQEFDVITALDVIEHVSDPTPFLCTCLSMLKPGGAMFVSTLNRTSLSYALAIVSAEYVLRMVPEGTHDWNKFITPDEFRAMVDHYGDYQVLNNVGSSSDDVAVLMEDVTGMVYNPLKNRWGLDSGNLEMNYITHITKM